MTPDEARAEAEKDQKAKEAAREEPTRDVDLRSTFHHSVEEGMERTQRQWPDLLSTGLMGGVDVSLGVLAMLVVQHATGSDMAASLAFSIGFLALMLGKSELFTENFLVPVAAVVAGKATVAGLLRLWGTALVMNLVGGWLFGWLIIWGLPDLVPAAVERGRFFAEAPTGQLAVLGLLAGACITLMTWMEHGARGQEVSRLAAVVSIAFLLAAAHLAHLVVASIEMFIGLNAGQADYTYGDWARLAAIATVANLVGGLFFVTVLRLIQVGPRAIEAERHRPAGSRAPRP